MATNNSNKPPEVSSADQAIRRVLQAEGETRDAINECEQAAHAILLEARQRARRIHDRTDQRISNMKVRAAQRVSATLHDMRETEARARLDQVSRPLDETGLHECIEQVARLLSGGTPEWDENGESGQ